jgi:hypothetical protein
MSLRARLSPGVELDDFRQRVDHISACRNGRHLMMRYGGTTNTCHSEDVATNAGRLFAGFVSLIALAGCGSSDPGSAVVATTTSTSPAQATTTEPPTESTTAVTSTTTVASVATTTPPPTTTVPETTTTVEVVAGLALRTDGVGRLRFGQPVVQVIDTLVAALGDPMSDAAFEYPVDTDGVRFDAFGDFSFGYPYGRQTCFTNEFCVEAGGPTPAELVFVGWTQSEGEGSLITTLGIGIGTVWADAEDVMSVDEGGCFSFGTGASGGIDLQLQSSGAMFTATDSSGAFVIGEPDPADVAVVALSAGDLRTFVYGDC